APNGGLTLVVRAGPAGGMPFLALVGVVLPDRIVLADLGRQARLVLPIPDTDRVLFNLACEPSKKPERGKNFQIHLGMAWKSSSKPRELPFEVRARFSPAAMISLAHLDKPKTTVDERFVKLVTPSVAITIDRKSGRPSELRWTGGGGGSLTCRFERGAHAVMVQALDGRLDATRDEYDVQSPWKPLAEFFIDEWIAVTSGVGSSEGLETMRALRRLCQRWTPPAFNDLLSAWLTPTPENFDEFRIPWHNVIRPLGDDSPVEPRVYENFVMGWLPVYRRLVPKTGWMWPVGRGAALHYVSHSPTVKANLETTIASGEVGPFGRVLLGTVGPLLQLPPVGVAGEDALPHLSTAAFRKDYAPLLAKDSWLGNWFVSLAEALRGLNQEELSALSRFVSGEQSRMGLFAILMQLKLNPEEPIEPVLAGVLDRFWASVLRDSVESALTKMPRARIAKARQPHVDSRVRPASAESQKADPKNDRGGTP
ncbi:MAG: hypothetical protein ACM3U2_04995, partial [Deltaproteobacteria bacterium]